MSIIEYVVLGIIITVIGGILTAIILKMFFPRTLKSSNVQAAKTIISIEQLQGGTIYTGDHYVVHKEETDLDLQIGGLVDDKMRFSILYLLVKASLLLTGST